MESTSPVVAAPRRRSRQVVGIVRYVATILIIILVVRAFISPYQVDGRSMTPNLHDHDRVFVNRVRYLHFDINAVLNVIPGVDRQGTDDWYPFSSPHRGDIVVLNPPIQSDQPFIKRVIGLPGESVSFKGGYVYIDGVKLDEPYINGAITTCDSKKVKGFKDVCNISKIPDGMVYVLGDNRRDSEDSRYFGPVSIDQILGKAWITNWPLSDAGHIPSYSYDVP